jgi:Rad3-related DNA helicase
MQPNPDNIIPFPSPSEQQQKTDSRYVHHNPIALKSKYSKFADSPFRPHQSDSIRFALTSNSKISIIKAPTGSGKTVIGACIGAAYPSYIYLVSSKALQTQIINDFPEMRSLKGRNNYTCKRARLSTRTCADCTHTRSDPCPYKAECHYETQKLAVLDHPYKLLNYHYFLYESNYVGRFSSLSQIIVCDEGDMLEHLLSDFVSLSIHGQYLSKLNLDPPKYKTTTSDKSIPSWQEWARDLSYEIFAQLKHLETMQQSTDEDTKIRAIKETQQLESILQKISIFVDYLDPSWILQLKQPRNPNYKPTVTFKPTWIPPQLSNQYFFNHSTRFVLMSATFPPASIMGKLIGQSADDMQYHETPSNFPVEHRPVYLWRVANITAKTFDAEIPKLISKITEILDKHPTDRGIIHTVSYKIAQYIQHHIPSNRLLFHETHNREDVLSTFKQSTSNHVLVSPSMERGVDLPDDMARFIIICKAPYEHLGDPLVNKRLYGSGNIGQLWYSSATAQTIVQMAGRGVRHKTDHAITYVLDSQAVDLILNHRQLFPNYFIEACEI